MAFKTVLNTALHDKVITPEMKQILEESLFTLTFDRDDMQMLETLLRQLVSGVVTVMEVS